MISSLILALPLTVYLATGPILSNLAIIARQKGFSSGIVGLLFTSFHVTLTLVKPMICSMTDRFRIHTPMFIAMQGLTALTFFSVYFIPSTSNQVTVYNDLNTSQVYFCPKNPTWDKCLDHRIQSVQSKMFKCQLKCLAESPSTDIRQEFQYEIVLDMTSVQKTETCLMVGELPYSSIEGIGTFSSEQKSTYDCDATCEDDFFKGTLVDRGAISDDEVYKHYQLWLFGALFLIGYSAKSVVYSISDTICFDLLGNDELAYGKQRVWDSIAAGINSLVIGVAIDAVSGGSVFKNYTILYYSCLIVIGFNMVNASKLKYKQPEESKSIAKDVGKLFRSARAITFFAWCILGGFFSAAIWSFLFWHLEEMADNIGQNECGDNHIKTLEGIDLFVQCIIGELPIWYFSGYLFKKIGHINCMHLVFGAFAIRFFYYSQLTNPWWVLPIEVLNGLTYGLLFSTIPSYANLLAPHGTEATLQGIVGALSEGIGVSLGSFVAGVLFEVYGGHTTFKIFALMSLTAMVVHILIHAILRYCNNKEKSHKIIVDMENIEMNK